MIFVVYQIQLDKIIIPVFDICFVPYAGSMQLPTPSVSVTVQQLGTQTAVAWDACQSKSVIDAYVGVQGVQVEGGCRLGCLFL